MKTIAPKNYTKMFDHREFNLGNLARSFSSRDENYNDEHLWIQWVVYEQLSQSPVMGRQNDPVRAKRPGRP